MKMELTKIFHLHREGGRDKNGDYTNVIPEVVFDSVIDDIDALYSSGDSRAIDLNIPIIAKMLLYAKEHGFNSTDKEAEIKLQINAMKWALKNYKQLL